MVVELLPETEWKGASENVADVEGPSSLLSHLPPERETDQSRTKTVVEKNDDPEPEEETSAVPSTSTSAAPVPTAAPQPTGRVVGVTKRNWRTYVCHLDRSSLPPSALTSTTSTAIFASPVSRSIPRIRILTRQALLLSSQKFLVSIDRWSVGSRYPEGHFVRSLGEVGSKEGELESLLEEWEVPYRAFSAGILDCLPKEGEAWVVPPQDDDPKGIWNGREDFREMIICSIDPPGALLLLWGCWGVSSRADGESLGMQAARISTTRFTLAGCRTATSKREFVRPPSLVLPLSIAGLLMAGSADIADVSHFVHPDNAMDAEAASRGTTVYLVDKRVDMLPSLLGTNLCSLRPYVERLAFSVLWVRFLFRFAVRRQS